jgi:hypothetical protein
MAAAVQKITLWSRETENKPGALDAILKPLAEAGADLSIVFGWVYPNDPTKARVEVAPIRGKKVTQAATSVGLTAEEIPVLVVQGVNRPGLGHQIASRLAEQGINLKFIAAQVVGKNYSAVFGFEQAADLPKAAKLISGAIAAAARKGGNQKAPAKKKASPAK